MNTVVETSVNETSLDYKSALEALREKIRMKVLESLENDPALANAMRYFCAGGRSPDFEVQCHVVAELCFHNFVGTGILTPADQEWCVD